MNDQGELSQRTRDPVDITKCSAVRGMVIRQTSNCHTALNTKIVSDTRAVTSTVPAASAMLVLHHISVMEKRYSPLITLAHAIDAFRSRKFTLRARHFP